VTAPRHPLAGIRAVAFDAVGTVILPNPGAAFVYERIAAAHGVAVDAAAIGPRLWDRYRIEEGIDRASGWITGEARERERWGNIVRAAIPEATPELFEELFQHFAKPSAWAVIDGVGETLRELESRGLILALASNYDRRLESVVAGHPELAPLRRVVISSVVGIRKPGHGFFRDGVLPALGCPADEVLFVGDDFENDYLGSQSARMRPLLFDPKGLGEGRVERIASMAELLR